MDLTTLQPAPRGELSLPHVIQERHPIVLPELLPRIAAERRAIPATLPASPIIQAGAELGVVMLQQLLLAGESGHVDTGTNQVGHVCSCETLAAPLASIKSRGGKATDRSAYQPP